MSQPLTEENVEAILALCQENLAGVAEALGRCFDLSVSLTAGESGFWGAERGQIEMSRPGALALIGIGGQALAVLIPDNLPLPSWYTRPGENEKSRLDTLPMEWSMSLLPEDLEADQYATFAVEDLTQSVNRMRPADWAATIDLLVEGGPGTDATLLKVVWPLDAPRFSAEPAAASPASGAVRSIPSSPGAPVGDGVHPGLARLSGVPVQISVLLAEKRIPLGQMLSITPGALITFNKSCEDLLDLYVNNSLYCRGEAVKIGENFGLKVNQVGVVRTRTDKVINT